MQNDNSKLKMPEQDQEQKHSRLKRGIKLFLTVFFIIFILAIAGSLFYFNKIINTPASKNSQKKYFEVKKDQSSVTIANNLEAKSLIKSGLIFTIYSKIKDKPLQTGIYELPQNLTIIEVFEIIANGRTQIIKFTIPEGYRTEQIGQLLEDKNVGDYSDFVEKAKQYEGQLFPDTYYISPEYSSDKIISLMLENYKNRTEEITVSPDDLIIASIVEREAVLDSERPIIAGVYKNRVALKMKLEADPTVQYGKDNNEISGKDNDFKLNFSFWGKITKNDYTKVQSPYNTYLISGLPPKPICNPGIKSIEATINYSSHNFIYFIQDNGQIYLSETWEGHEENKLKVWGSN